MAAGDLSLQYGGGCRIHMDANGSIAWVPRSVANASSLTARQRLQQHLLAARRGEALESTLRSVIGRKQTARAMEHAAEAAAQPSPELS